MSLRYISEVSAEKLSGTALVRLDLNTEDAWRAKRAVPTFELLKKKAEKIVIMSHYGRPRETVSKNGTVSRKTLDKFSLERHRDMLSKLLRRKVIFIPHWRVNEIKEEISTADDKSVFLLENLRFHSGEKKNSAMFAKALASLGDYYINEAFAVSHRKVTSVVAITEHLPSYGGIDMKDEIKNLTKASRPRVKPVVIVLGGGKAADKLAMLRHFKTRADAFLLGGAPANTMLFLSGEDVGGSLYDKDKEVLNSMEPFLEDPRVHIPTDWKTEKDRILDIGPDTANAYASIIKRAGTIIWSGPLGLFERKKFALGSVVAARAVKANKRAFSVTGGGETVMFLRQNGLEKAFSFISTGGGAMIEFLGEDQLPGIEALR